MDINYLKFRILDAQRELTEASNIRTASTHRLIGVIQHLEERLNATWQELEENEAHHCELMGEYRQLTGLLLTVNNAIREVGSSRQGYPSSAKLKTFSAPDAESEFDPEVFRAGIYRLIRRRERLAKDSPKAAGKGTESLNKGIEPAPDNPEQAKQCIKSQGKKAKSPKTHSNGSD